MRRTSPAARCPAARCISLIGEASKTITVQVAGDTMGEQREGFAVVLTSAPTRGATLGVARVVAAIGNDDDIQRQRRARTPWPAARMTTASPAWVATTCCAAAAATTPSKAATGQDTILGGAGADSLDGGPGDADELSYAGATAGVTVDLGLGRGFGGDAQGDTLAGFEVVRGGHGDDSLVGSDGPDSLYGGAGADTLVGGAGDDRLAGGTGANRLAGGEGNDIYVVQSAADTVIEAEGQGFDTVYASVSHTLADHVEMLNLAGGDAIDGTGNGLDNRIIGGSGDNLLRGMGGSDTLLGGDGADTLVGGAGADQLSGGAGADLFVFTASSDSSRSAIDAIHGFASGEDRIDLAAIGSEMGGWATEAFILGAGFTAAHQLAWDAAAGLLRIDTDGDTATAEMLIRFSAGTTLMEGDLILA